MFLYTKNKWPEIEIKEIIPLTIAPKTIKYLGINLTMVVKDLYIENYKILIKKSKKTQINGRIASVHGSEELI